MTNVIDASPERKNFQSRLSSAAPLIDDFASRDNASDPVHRAARLFATDLERRGITLQQAERAGLSYVPDARCVGAPHALPAIVLPYFDVSGERRTYVDGGNSLPVFRIRYLDTPPRGFVERKAMRYWQPPRSPAAVYFPRNVEDTDWPAISADAQYEVMMTEGEFKAQICCQQGFPCLGIGGVWNIYTTQGALLPELDAIAWQGRTVYVVFDSDRASNPNVLHAERRLSKELAKRGAFVHVVQVPHVGHGKTGVDDFLLREGADALLDLLRSTPRADPAASLISEGSDVELAAAVLAQLAEHYTSAVEWDEGHFYVWAQSHWCALDDPTMVNAVCDFDGTPCGQRGRIKLTDAKIKSVISIMRAKAANSGFFADAPMGVNCRNGFIRIDCDGISIEPHSREHRQRHCLPGAWSPGADWRDAPLLCKLLKGCFGENTDFAERVQFVAELFGVAALGMGTRLKAPKAVVMYGPGADNGKSQLLDAMRGLLPAAAVSAIPLTRFSDERMLIGLVGKKLNAVAELGTAQAVASDEFKKAVTGDQIRAKQIYQPAIDFKPEALHVYATNVLPSFHGGMDRGVVRRLAVLTFDRTIPKEEQVEGLGSRVATEEADALLAFAVEGAARIIRNGHYTEPASCREALREWTSSADPVIAWFWARAEYKIGNKLAVKDAYNDFKLWAQDEGFGERHLPAVNNFVQRVKAQDGRLGGTKNDSDRRIVGLALKAIVRAPRLAAADGGRVI